MQKLSALALFLLFLAIKINATPIDTLPFKIVTKTEYNKLLDPGQLGGTILVLNEKAATAYTNNEDGIYDPYLPASTFKIVNLLIALETGVIKDADEVVKWPGHIDTVLYGNRKDIFHDMTVREAFKVSAGWVFLQLAERVGTERYHKYLSLCGYGNENIDEPIGADFWNFGALAITPLNQLQVVRDLYYDRLPFKKEYMDKVKDIMITEQNSLYTLHSKTGWTRVGGHNIGWWVGYVEQGDDVYFFATCIRQLIGIPGNKYFGRLRLDITKQVLKDAGVKGLGQ